LVGWKKITLKGLIQKDKRNNSLRPLRESFVVFTNNVCELNINRRENDLRMCKVGVFLGVPVP